MKYSKLALPSALVLALVGAFSAQAFAAAGTAQFTAGDVQLKRADGGLTPLAKGKDIDSGQAIVTGADGRAQVRFTDGGLVSLQPNTEFKIASYVDKLDAKEDRFLVDLLRGSMRAITGLIGKRNRDNYKVNTATATIGIRGSGFNVGYNPDGTLSVTTELDAIEVCTAGGCVGLTAGESVKVLNDTQAPVRTNVRATVPTPPPVQEAQLASQQAGLLTQFKAPAALSLPIEPTNVPGNNLTINNVGVLANAFAPEVPTAFDPIGLPAGPGVVSALVDPSGRVLLFDAPGGQGNTLRFMPINDTVGSYGSSALPPSDANWVGWGSWGPTFRTDSTQNSSALTINEFTYVTGRASLNSAGVPTAGIGTYTALGGTTPIFSDSTTGARTAGTFRSASLVVNFFASSVKVSVDTSLGSFSGLVTPMGSQRTFVAGSPSSASYSGFLIGPTGQSAGLTYSIPFTNGSLNGFTTGAVGFNRTLLAP